MKMTGKAMLALAAVFTAGQIVMPVMAHESTHSVQEAVYSQCNVEGCSETDIHEHENVVYSGHTDEDGHAEHSTDEDKTENKEHKSKEHKSKEHKSKEHGEKKHH